MMKKPALFVMLLGFMFFVAGCITVNSDGCCPGNSTNKCASKEVKPAAPKGPNMIDKADSWVKENLW